MTQTKKRRVKRGSSRIKGYAVQFKDGAIMAYTDKEEAGFTFSWLKTYKPKRPVPCEIIIKTKE